MTVTVETATATCANERLVVVLRLDLLQRFLQLFVRSGQRVGGQLASLLKIGSSAEVTTWLSWSKRTSRWFRALTAVLQSTEMDLLTSSGVMVGTCVTSPRPGSCVRAERRSAPSKPLCTSGEAR